MRSEAAAGIPGRTLKLTVATCAAGAAASVLVGFAAGVWPAGVGLAAGLLLGSLNGFAAQRSLGIETGFRASSLLRLAVLSAAGIGVGLTLGSVVSVVLGIGLAQLALAGSALREGLRK